MNTYTGKKITKKRIAQVLRSGNRTDIFKLAHQLGVDTSNRSLVSDFVRENAPNKKISGSIWSLVWRKNSQDRPYDHNYGIVNTRLCEAVAFAKAQKKEGRSNYSKKLIEGHRNIYWAHPQYGHSDYNKGVAFANTERNRKIADLINKYLGY